MVANMHSKLACRSKFRTILYYNQAIGHHQSLRHTPRWTSKEKLGIRIVYIVSWRKKNNRIPHNKHNAGDKLVYNMLRAKMWCQYFCLPTMIMIYEVAADDLCVLNPNRFSNNFGAIGGILAGSGAIKFTIFSWTLYLHQIIQKLFSS